MLPRKQVLLRSLFFSNYDLSIVLFLLLLSFSSLQHASIILQNFTVLLYKVVLK